MAPNPNDADRKLDFFVNIAVMQILAILQTIAGIAGFTGDEYIVFFTRLIARMHSSVANSTVASPASVDEPLSGSATSSSGVTSSHSISPQSGDRLGVSPELSSAPSPMDTSDSTVAASRAPVASTTFFEPQTTLAADITSGSTPAISTSSNDTSTSESEAALAASPRIATEVTEAVTPLAASSSSATPTDDRSLRLTSIVPSNTTRRRPRPLRREGACIFHDVAGQVVPVSFPLPAAPTIVPYAPAPLFFTPAAITAATTSALDPVSSTSDTASHPLTLGKPVPASPTPSSASSKRSRDEVDFEDDDNEAARSSCSSASPPKRRRS